MPWIISTFITWYLSAVDLKEKMVSCEREDCLPADKAWRAIWMEGPVWNGSVSHGHCSHQPHFYTLSLLREQED